MDPDSQKLKFGPELILVWLKQKEPAFADILFLHFKLIGSELTDRPVISQTLGFTPSTYPFTVCPFPVFFTCSLQYITLCFSCDQQPYYETKSVLLNKIRNIDWYQIISYFECGLNLYFFL